MLPPLKSYLRNFTLNPKMLLQELWNMFQGLQFPTSLKLANICLFRLDLAIVRSLQRSCAFLWKAIPHLPSPGSMPPPCDGRRSPSRGFFTPYWNGLLIYHLATWQNCKFPRSRDSILLLLYLQS